MGTDHRERIEQLAHEHVDVAPYDPRWPALFEEERDLLSALLPPDLFTRIEHIGSTAVPGLSAKPVIDMQVETTDLDRARMEVAPLLQARGYEFIWRPSIGEAAPFYAWFIKRDPSGQRTHHIHMVVPDRASEDRIRFRDHLRADPAAAARYETLKRDLALRYPNDRVAYTREKTGFIRSCLDATHRY